MKSALLPRAEADAIVAIALHQARRQVATSPLRAALADPLDFLDAYGKVRTQRAIEPFQVLDWHRRVLAEATGRAEKAEAVAGFLRERLDEAHQERDQARAEAERLRSRRWWRR